MSSSWPLIVPKALLHRCATTSARRAGREAILKTGLTASDVSRAVCMAAVVRRKRSKEELSKNIVICADGTGNSYFGAKSNVFQLFEIALKGHARQLACY